MGRLTRQIKSNWFLLGLAVAIALALLVPQAGDWLNPRKVTSTAAVVAIFLLSGLSLPSEEMRHGLRNWRMHLYLQAFVFGVCGAYFYLTAAWAEGLMQGRLVVGLYALGVLPTTISSCIVFTQLAGGNAAGTIFNAVLANLAGVFLSPLLLTLMLRGGQTALPWSEVGGIFLGLLGKVLLPFVAGQVLHFRLSDWAGRHRRTFSEVSSVLILLIVFFAFTRAARSDVLRENVGRLWAVFAYLAGSNVLLMALAAGGAKLVGLGRRDVVSALFVGPQKTLALGVPLLGTYFAARPELVPLAILPILFYHPWQLLTAGVARSLMASPAPEPARPDA